ncbi:MAG TPA: condensation domain-containing protein, partial [Pilimelia sp.]|nr:condensation domain-containing protein [Pilimelia sp.]
MLTHATDPQRALVEPADLDGVPPDGVAAAYAGPLREVLAWARAYLCQPHPNLGRNGSVCPYAQGALDRQTFYLAVHPGVPDGIDGVVETLLAYRDWFERLGPPDDPAAMYRTILLVLPDLPADRVTAVVDGAQAALKGEFVARGLMVGEFHDGPPAKAGLWNPSFRPLRSPVPLLAIRHMVPTDFPFLRDDPEHVAGYLARYADQVPSHLRDEVRAAVARFGLATGDGPDEPGTPVALTAAQQRLWFLNQLDPGNPVQHVATCLRLRGRLGRQAVARGVQALVARHPLLRLTLAERDGEPVAVVAAAADARVPLIDLTGLPPADREAAAERRIRGEVRRPFDLRRGPLLRGTLVRLGDDDHRLVLTAHRLAADARSLDELCLELGELYGATAPRVAADAAVPGVAADAADAAVPWVAADVPAQVEYWVRRLAGAPTALTLPTDRPRPAAQSYRGAVHRFTLPASLIRDVRSLTGGSLLPALLAAFGAVLARHSGQPEVLVGTGVDTRGRRSDVVGPYTNTVVVRATAGDGGSFRELLGRVRADLAAATAHGQAPFEHVVEALRVPRSMDRSPLFQAQVTVRESAPQLPVLPDLAVWRMPVDTGAVAVDLALTAEPATASEHAAPGDLHLVLEYSTDLFDASTAGRLAGHLATLLYAAAADPDRPVDELPLLTPAERATLLVDWQGPAVTLPEPASAGALLDRWADSDATAVVGPDGRLTYRELHRRANQLAHVLRAWGAGPDVPVGLCIERSAAMVVAMLGVWRAGAAYVPLDPAFPAERLRLMLADSAATVVVTNRPARERAAPVLAEAAGLICLDEDADVLAAQPEQPPA